MGRPRRRDAPGTYHHVVGRGVDRQPIFADDLDRTRFLERLGRSSRETGTEVLAWALLGNHYHLVARSTHSASLSAWMHRLAGGYARECNRRHGRSGPLFERRFFNSVLDSEEYWLAAVRYVLRNPLKHGELHSPAQLRFHPWTAVDSLLSESPRSFHATAPILQRFSNETEAARAAVWLWLQSPGDDGSPAPEKDSQHSLDALIRRIASHLGASGESLARGDRGREASRARAVIAALAVERGVRHAELAARLGTSRSGLTRAARRGRHLLSASPALRPPE